MMLAAVVFGLFFGTCAASCSSCDFQVDWQSEFNRLAPELQSFTYPLEENGKLFPGLTTQGLITTAGKVWGAKNVLVSFNMICRDVGPSLTLLLGPDAVGDLCDPVIEALKNDAPVDGIGICNAAFSLVTNGHAARMKRQAYYDYNQYYTDPLAGIYALRPLDPLLLLDQVARDMFGLTSYDQASVCNAFNHILNSDDRVPTIIEKFAEEFLVLASPRGAEICNSWSDIYNALFQSDVGYYSFYRDYFYFFSDLIDLIADTIGLFDAHFLCQELTDAVAKSNDYQLRDLVSALVDGALDTATTESKCSPFFNNLAKLLVKYFGYDANADLISPNVQYIFDVGSIDDVCQLVDDAFPPRGTTQNFNDLAENSKAKRRRRAPREDQPRLERKGGRQVSKDFSGRKRRQTPRQQKTEK
ncbi:uncharacterized protein [Diadema antillarum]|uniref:uncharacterized protein n=1 Tax=Diadema antillarum TaxID=105358 RepID=UPI003A838ADF